MLAFIPTHDLDNAINVVTVRARTIHLPAARPIQRIFAHNPETPRGGQWESSPENTRTARREICIMQRSPITRATRVLSDSISRHRTLACGF